ncbi:DUF3261 domain-containing protein [Serratia ficaria]|uniref:Protein of uncharacterized function (DUF3261) n=1 Tax=Serratia ficaria TaxID=61651 RepID=A0A240B3J9_SERFI|nr:DUF3261 domain-containing protein [Serratia ficaria]REF46250.1 uncharacterized protein DUF3261 [Serratia ficaria]CAI1190606.1 Protein of uncharacterised function (DUF3261) [Serratia ficaria]CAI1191803.1 Protein of uncharacterised function (DUF3261) [Serratia ficaria]CAI1221706.1 Protein of uncharacterised function (DUF3261) [Serratia ficaria]CAI2076074.1 Protein of uncharacterised function (DUF3261) [Serratia ficaria]
MHGLRIVLLSLAAALAGCAGSPSSVAPQAWLKPGARVTLPPPALAQPVAQQQLLTAEVKGQRHSMLVLLNADGQRLTLVGMSPLGIRLFNLTYDRQGIHTEQLIKVGELPPASQVLADIMLSYWPVNAWRPLLPAGWRLEDRPEVRRLYDERGAIVSEIRYQLGEGRRDPVSIAQSAFHYRISIQNLGEAG